MSKHIVFVIMPFGEDFLALYDNLKNRFRDDFEFTNSGDLDNQQNILHDIVEGIAQADVVIADLTGLNANVFYEFGLAHTMNKKVVIITQDLSELPFDIKSYRANEYSDNGCRPSPPVSPSRRPRILPNASRDAILKEAPPYTTHPQEIRCPPAARLSLRF